MLWAKLPKVVRRLLCRLGELKNSRDSRAFGETWATVRSKTKFWQKLHVLRA